MSVNVVNLVGRLGQDPDTRYFESGAVTTSFTLAVNTGKKDAPPDWFNIKTWSKTAEIAAQYTRKGSLVGITGSFEFERWKDRTTGADRQKLVVKVNQLTLLSSKSDNQQQSEQF